MRMLRIYSLQMYEDDFSLRVFYKNENKILHRVKKKKKNYSRSHQAWL